ncbi:MAG: DUF4058 family protein [Planctomycetes bacterium]|nr:DUF4058 family protein [Planctomycetota bacterium]
MPCPFPGMDPYLEKQPYWGDFTPGFIKFLAHELLAQLLPRYEVCVEEYLYLAHEEIRLHRVRPDVALTTRRSGPSAPASGIALLEVATEDLEYPAYEPSTQRHLKVIQPRTGRVVTVIEVLSPTNKAPGEDGIDAYLEKRAEYLAARTNLVEIDLLRGGERLPMAGDLPPGDYYVYVGRVQRKPRCQVIGWPWRRMIPAIPVPLLPEDGDAMVDLQAVFQAMYDFSFYERRLPYQEPLSPPLSEEEAAWVMELLKERGLTPS